MSFWNEYIENYPDEVCVKDGIVNEKKYSDERRRILFVLKDAKDFQTDFLESLQKGGEEKNVYVLEPVCQWAEALLRGKYRNEFENAEERSRILNRIAVMNLKKTKGISKRAVSYVDWAKGNIRLLLKQIEEINPHLIILCCDEAGIFFLNEHLFEGRIIDQLDDTEMLYGRKDGRLIISAVCPDEAEEIWCEWFAAFYKKFLTRN